MFSLARLDEPVLSGRSAGSAWCPRSASSSPTTSPASRSARIERKDGEPFALAGIWKTWDTRGADGVKDGNRLHSFSLLTINADNHPLMRQFHAPGDEKRSVVVVPRDRWEDWIRAANDEEARSLLFADEFQACADPAPPPKKTAA